MFDMFWLNSAAITAVCLFFFFIVVVVVFLCIFFPDGSRKRCLVLKVCKIYLFLSVKNITLNLKYDIVLN